MKENKTILVLEDERPLLSAIKLKITNAGFEVVTARSVEQALGYLQDAIHIDAIWLDHYLLGRENGLDFVTKLKADEGPWKSIPIFVVSNTATSDTLKTYLHLGVENYFVKSDKRLDEIISEIKEVLTTHSS